MKAKTPPASTPSLISRIEANFKERAALAVEFREITEGLNLRDLVGEFYKHRLEETSALPSIREKLLKGEARKAALAMIPRKLAKEAGFVV